MLIAILFILALFFQLIWPINFLLIFLISSAFFLPLEKLIYFALGGGIFLDSFSRYPLGFTSLILLLILTFYFWLNRFFSLKNFVSFILFLIFANIVYNYLINFLY